MTHQGVIVWESELFFTEKIDSMILQCKPHISVNFRYLAIELMLEFQIDYWEVAFITLILVLPFLRFYLPLTIPNYNGYKRMAR